MRRIEARDHFLKILEAAQSQRDQKGVYVDDLIGGREVPGWVLFERRVMLAEVNRWRADRNLEPINERKLCQVEQLAVGHIDYSRKFALYCAELGLGEDQVQP